MIKNDTRRVNILPWAKYQCKNIFSYFYKNETQFIRESMTYIAKTCSKNLSFWFQSNFLILFYLKFIEWLRIYVHVLTIEHINFHDWPTLTLTLQINLNVFFKMIILRNISLLGVIVMFVLNLYLTACSLLSYNLFYTSLCCTYY